MIEKTPQGYIHKWRWDVLVILDACRLDYFKMLNPFKGKLKELEVESSNTQLFLEMNFPDKYPYVYISANPFCNSKMKVGNFLGRDHFYRVVDVWNWGWDSELLTVLPHRVTSEYFFYKHYPKVIVHYIQPHPPFIGKIKLRYGGWKNNPLDIATPETYNRPSVDILRKAYKENLRFILEEVKKIVKYAPKDRKIVITSDHGEFLGEDGMFEHPAHIKHPCLNHVPWFEVKR